MLEVLLKVLVPCFVELHRALFDRCQAGLLQHAKEHFIVVLLVAGACLAEHGDFDALRGREARRYKCLLRLCSLERGRDLDRIRHKLKLLHREHCLRLYRLLHYGLDEGLRG